MELNVVIGELRHDDNANRQVIDAITGTVKNRSCLIESAVVAPDQTIETSTFSRPAG